MIYIVVYQHPFFIIVPNKGLGLLQNWNQLIHKYLIIRYNKISSEILRDLLPRAYLHIAFNLDFQLVRDRAKKYLFVVGEKCFFRSLATEY